RAGGLLGLCERQGRPVLVGGHGDRGAGVVRASGSARGARDIRALRVTGGAGGVRRARRGNVPGRGRGRGVGGGAGVARRARGVRGRGLGGGLDHLTVPGAGGQEQG